MVDEGAKTRQEKTDENLQALLKNNLVEIKVLMKLVQLLLNECSKYDIAALKGLIAVQKTVTDTLVKGNDQLKTQTARSSKLESTTMNSTIEIEI